MQIEKQRQQPALATASVDWTKGEQFVGMAKSGHAIVLDADRESDTGNSPMEVVLIGLCACTADDVVTILKKKREPFTSLTVRAEAERAPEPPKVYTHIKLVYTVGGQVSQKAMEDAVRLSKEKYCSVSAMLQHIAKIEVVIEYK